jgi:predicted dehydrogenase
VKRRPVRIAIVGAGLIGRLHARVASESPETELVAIVDSDPAADRVARERRVRRCSGIDELLTDVSVDAVVVSVPTDQHVTTAKRFLAASIPVLVEKPLADSVEEAEALVACAAAAGVTLGVGHVERFNPAVRALADRLAEGSLGRVFQIAAQRLSPFPARSAETGVAHDLATHDLDVMCILAGPPARISAEVNRRADRSREDLLAAVVRFDSGVVGVLDVNWLTPFKVRRLTVTGERGLFRLDYLTQQLTLYEHGSAAESWEELELFGSVPEGDVLAYAVHREEPLRAQLDAFARAVRGEEPVAVSGEEGTRVVALAAAAIEAATTGRTIDLRAGRAMVTDEPA